MRYLGTAWLHRDVLFFLLRGLPMRFAVSALSLVLAACSSSPARDAAPDFLASETTVTTHRDGDDLLSAGLGLEGLRTATAPAFAVPERPTPAELRRRALHANWRGITDFSPAGGYGTVYGGVPAVPGREYSAFARVQGAQGTHRVLAQVPDAFDRKARCLVVAAASGSRGVYGATAMVGAWGLPRGCAVVHTDKGAGTGFVDLDTGTGVALDGTRVALAGPRAVEFDPGATSTQAHRVAFKHAHSRDNTERDWGRHVLQAARFGLHALGQAFPADAPFTAANTRVIAAAVSNGAGAVLRAGELDDAGLIDAVVAVAPNVAAPGARPLYDVASEAALLQHCALLALPDAPSMLPAPAAQAVAGARCAALHAAGTLSATTAAEQAREALQTLHDGGWEEGALQLTGLNVAFDLWRAVVATYAQGYTRAGVDVPTCGYGFAMVDAKGVPRASTEAERALWWSDATGVAPTAGVAIVDALAAGNEPALPGLACARALWTGGDAMAPRLRAGVEEVRANARPRVPYTLVVHGRDDGLVPVAFTSRPYVAAARANGAAIAYWDLPNAQHFDAFLGVPAFGARYVPLLPYAYAAMDQVYAHVVEGAPAPRDRVFATKPRGADTLDARHLGLP